MGRHPVENHAPAGHGQLDDDPQPGQVDVVQGGQVQVDLVEVRGDLRKLPGQAADGGLVDLARQRVDAPRPARGQGQLRRWGRGRGSGLSATPRRRTPGGRRRAAVVADREARSPGHGPGGPG